jgi:cysteine synthase
VTHRGCAPDRTWVNAAIEAIEADVQRSADTHLLRFPLPRSWSVDLYLKDESTHPSGSLKHRLARSLFLYGLCNGWIGEGTTVVEASSGSTAVSEAYFAKLIGLPFVAVMPSTTSPEKIALIERQDGTCHLVDDPATVYAEAARLAAECNGHYLDQFTYAERATDWRGNNNIAESIFEQMNRERYPIPEWVVIGAGTGGTSATIGRYVRFRRHSTQLCVVDPENSVFADFFDTGDPSLTLLRGSLIEGIGRPRVEPSFVPEIVDRVIRVPDAASIACVRLFERVLGRRVGGSTGTNLWGCFQLVAQMRATACAGSIVTLLCDDGTRYAHTYFDAEWLQRQGMDPTPYEGLLDLLLSGEDAETFLAASAQLAAPRDR